MPTKKEVILKFSDPTYVPTDAEFGEWKFAREKLGEVNNFTIDKATEIAGETVKQVASELKDGVTSTARLLSEGEYGKMLVSAAEGMVRGTVDLNILGRKIWDTIASFGDDESAAFQRDREIRKMVRIRESAKKGGTSLLASAASSGSQARKINSMVDPKMGEGTSYFLDPFMLTPLGVGGKMGKVAGKAAGGVAKAVGAAARLPEKAVGMVESGIARTAQRFLGDGSEEVTRRARTYADLIGLGGVAAAAGLPAAGTVATARLGVKGLDEAGKGAQAVGRAAAEGPSRFGLFERMSVDPELSQFSRRLAGAASSMGGDTAARVAKAGAVGAAEGAAVGSVLGGLADGAEGAIGGAVAGTMLGSLGGVTGLGVDHVTGKGEKRATANDIQRFASTLPEDQARAFKNLPYNAQGDIALAKGVIGDSVSFQVLRPKEFQQQVGEGGASAAHRVLPGTGESVIFIKESPNLSRADVLHEIGHAIYAQTPDIKTSVLQTIQGIYSPDEIRNIEMDYVSRLRSPDAVKRGKAFTDEEKASMVAEIKGTKGEDYFINEIFAETFADASIAHSLNRLRKGKLTPVVQEKLLDAKAAVFQKLGIKVKEDGSIDRAALMPWVKSSPRFQKLIAEYTKDLFTFRQNINKRPDPETVKLKFQLTDDELKNLDIGWKWNEDQSQYEHPLGTLIPGPGGKEDLKNGTVIRKTQKEIRAEDRARADEVNRVIDRETPRGADDPMLGRRRQIDGKTIISGKILPEGIYQVSSYNDSQKENMRTVQDSLESNDGTVFQIHYQPIGTSKGQGYKQSVRGTLGSMEMKVREIIPFEFKVTKKDGLNIQALDFTEVKERIKIWKKQGLLDRIYNGNVQAFQKDLSQYLSNLKERVPGETGIGQNKRDFMQAFLGGTKGVNPARGEVPASSRRSLIRSFRVDRTNTLKPAFGKNLVTGEFGPLKYGFDYYRMRDNLSPERIDSEDIRFSPEREEDYTYHRGIDPDSAKDIVLFSDDLDRISSYGKNIYRVKKSDLINIDNLPDPIKKDIENEFGDEYLDLLNPKDIVDSAGAWDDRMFVTWFQNYLESKGLLDKYKGFKTDDGAVLFPGMMVAEKFPENMQFSPEREALKNMDPGDASKKMNTSALNFFYNDKNPALVKPSVQVSNPEAASMLQDEAVKFWGEVVTSKDIEPWQKDILVETVVDEVKAALKADGKNAANWYTTDITAAIDIAKKLFPELENDSSAQATPAGFKNKDDAALGLFVATAITSQNLKVSQNTRYAVEQFETLIKTGSFDPKRNYGSKAKSINENLSLANKMIEDLGWSGLKKFISTEFTIKKLQDTMLNDHGLKVSIDGNVTDIVNGAAIFGPKIGQGFLQNLLGSFNPVTIDLWMRRTWGRWTGNVVNKQIKQEQIAGLISEMKKGRRRIPDALKKIKIKTDYRPSTGKEFITIPDRQYDAIQNSPEMVEAILKISKEIDREWQQVYTSLNRGIAPEDTARLLAGDVTPYKMAEKYNKIRERLKAKHKKLKASDPSIDPFSKWVNKVGMPSMGYTDKYGQWGQGTNVKPQFVRNAEAIVKTQAPIDAPSNADRKVITEVINNARGKLEDEGYTTTNADIQAILWYPEKDIWDQLTGRKENNLKSSYNDEFRKIAERKGISYSPHREPARVGWGSGSRQTGKIPDQINAGSGGGKSFSPERYFSLRSGHRIIHPPGRKVRLYAPSGALVGVYDSEEQAMRRASR